jgi:hypothetical protein
LPEWGKWRFESPCFFSELAPKTRCTKIFSVETHFALDGDSAHFPVVIIQHLILGFCTKKVISSLAPSNYSQTVGAPAFDAAAQRRTTLGIKWNSTL